MDERARTASQRDQASDAGGGRLPGPRDRAPTGHAVALQVTAIWTDLRFLDMSLLKSKEAVVAEAA